jgi:arsenate reductase (thioredoxin)
MAAGYLQALAGDRIQVLSAGTQPKDKVNPSAIEAMAEEGIDIANNVPKVLSDETVKGFRLRNHNGLRRCLPILPRQDLPRLATQRSSGQRC